MFVDTALNVEKARENLGDDENDDYYGNVQFVNFNFEDGRTLQVAVYNCHNGYYGHDVYFYTDSMITLETDL